VVMMVSFSLLLISPTGRDAFSSETAADSKTSRQLPCSGSLFLFTGPRPHAASYGVFFYIEGNGRAFLSFTRQWRRSLVSESPIKNQSPLLFS